MIQSKGDSSSDVDIQLIDLDDSLLDDSTFEMDNLAENFMDLELTNGG